MTAPRSPGEVGSARSPAARSRIMTEGWFADVGSVSRDRQGRVWRCPRDGDLLHLIRGRASDGRLRVPRSRDTIHEWDFSGDSSPVRARAPASTASFAFRIPPRVGGSTMSRLQACASAVMAATLSGAEHGSSTKCFRAVATCTRSTASDGRSTWTSGDMGPMSKPTCRPSCSSWLAGPARPSRNVVAGGRTGTTCLSRVARTERLALASPSRSGAAGLGLRIVDGSRRVHRAVPGDGVGCEVRQLVRRAAERAHVVDGRLTRVRCSTDRDDAPPEDDLVVLRHRRRLSPWGHSPGRCRPCSKLAPDGGTMEDPAALRRLVHQGELEARGRSRAPERGAQPREEAAHDSDDQ